MMCAHTYANRKNSELEKSEAEKGGKRKCVTQDT